MAFYRDRWVKSIRVFREIVRYVSLRLPQKSHTFHDLLVRRIALILESWMFTLGDGVHLFFVP